MSSFPPANKSRRRLLTGALATPLVGAPSAADAAGAIRKSKRRALRLDEPADSLRALVKLRGDLSGAMVLQYYGGSLSLSVAGRPPARVASYQGIIRSHWTPQPDGSFRYRTFDLGYFGDPVTRLPVSSLINALTGERLAPLDIRDGPVEALYTVHGIFRDGAQPDTSQQLRIDWRQSGDRLWYESFFPFQFPNPLPPEDFPELTSFPDAVQGSWFSYRGRRSELEDTASNRAPGETVLTVVSTVHPWLRMGQMPAMQLVQTVAQKIDSLEQAPPEVRDYLARTMPEFLTAATPFVGAGNSYERYRRERKPAARSRAVSTDAANNGANLATAASADIRRWRQYADSRLGQVHVWSAEPQRQANTRVPLICLHPSPTSGEMYRDLQRELARNRSVHCPDTPGFGSSDAPLLQPGIADFGGALGDAFVSLGFGNKTAPRGQLDLFGFHTGSLCAVELALQYPHMVRRLILCGVPHYDNERRPRERAAHVAPYPYFSDPSYVSKLYQRLVIDAKDSGDAEMRLRRFGDRLRAGSKGWWGPDAVFTYDSVAALPKLAVPTLLIAFNEEMTQPTRDAQQLIPGAKIIEMLDLPIFGFIAAPQRVANTIRDFLDQDG